jgi:hypothetical protein
MPGANPQSDTPQRGPAWLSRLPPWSLVVGLFFLLLWMPAAFLAMFIPGHYLPSEDWLRFSRPIAYALVGISFVWTVLVLARGSKHTDANAYVDGIVVAGVILGLFYAPISDLVHKNIPALLAAVFGSEVNYSFTVIAADRPSDKWCRTPVELEGMPFMTQLCGVGNDFRSRLSPGQTVVFGGTGTWMGLYVDYMLQPDGLPTTLPRPRPPR